MGLTSQQQQQLASSAPAPRPGSITSGLPRAAVEIYNTAAGVGSGGVRQAPDVSITKQPVTTAGGRLDYPLHHHSSNNLSSLADIALQQPKMLEDPRGASLTVTRADGRQPGGVLLPADIARLGGKYDERATAMARAAASRQLEEDQRLTIARLSQLNSEECMKLLEQAKRAGGTIGGLPEQGGLTAASLIDLIVTNQINQGSIPPEALRNVYASAAAAAAASGSRHSPHGQQQHQHQQHVADSGKDSPGKQQQPRSSPSLRQMTEQQQQRGEENHHVRTSPAMMSAPSSLGDHIESMIAKEVQNRTSPYGMGPAAAAAAAAEAANETWKRRHYAAAANDPGFAAAAAAALSRPPSQGGGGGVLPRPPSVSAASSSQPPPQLVADERQIIRVAQNASPHPGGDHKPPSRSAMMLEPISPPTNSNAPPSVDASRGSGPPYFYPDPMARFLAAQRKPSPHEMMAAADQAAAMVAAGKNQGGPAMFDYVKHKIAEVMKNDKPGSGNSSPAGGDGMSSGHNKLPTPVSSNSAMMMMMGPPHSSNKRPLDGSIIAGGADSRRSPAAGGPLDASNSAAESPRKRYKMEESTASAVNSSNNDMMPDSPGSPEMVIDESAGRPDSAHSHKTASPAPGQQHSDHPSPYAGGFGRGGHHPPRSSPQQLQRPPQQQQQPAVAAGGGQLPGGYDPLSDDD